VADWTMKFGSISCLFCCGPCATDRVFVAFDGRICYLALHKHFADNPLGEERCEDVHKLGFRYNAEVASHRYQMIAL